MRLMLPEWYMPASRQAVYLQAWHLAPFLLIPDMSITIRTSHVFWLLQM